MTLKSFYKRIVFTLSVITMILILFQIIILVAAEYYFLNYNSRFAFWFDLNREKNLPAVFSALLLFLPSVLMLFISYREINIKRILWFGLSMIFLFLSCDELFAIHERTIIPLRNFFNTSGYLFFAWVIPYSLGLLILVFIYFKFLFSLPKKTKFLVILSGIIYVTGALGFELIGGKQFERDGEIQTLTFRILYTIEESLEMSGSVMFNYALMDYIVMHLPGKAKVFNGIGIKSGGIKVGVEE